MPRKTLSAAKRVEYRFFYDAMRKFEWDLRHRVWSGEVVPLEWAALINDDTSPDRTRVTLRLDSDIVRFFRRHWGRGYQLRINAVLRMFLKLKLSGLVHGPESLDVIARSVEEDEDGTPRPAFGDWEDFITSTRTRHGREG